MMKKDRAVSMATAVPSNKINSSEDHMDLGPFLQEYVLRNPFNPLCEPPAQPVAPSSDGSHDDSYKPEEESRSGVRGGHIGSNVGYAHQLKQLRLPRRHAKVRQWLLQHYKYASFYSGWVSSDALLKEVKGPFSDMKSSVLSRIMKFTYPECRKVINRYGYFYMGLIKRPSAAEFKKENLVRAAKEVNKNTNNVSSVAVKHKLDSFQLASVYVWLDDGPLLETGGTGRKERKCKNSASSEKEESEWHPDEDDDMDENEDNVNKPLPRLRSLRKRTRNAVLGYLRAKLKPVGRENDTSDDNEPEDKKSKKNRKDNSAWKVKKEQLDIEGGSSEATEENMADPPIKIGEVITVKQEPCDDYFAFKSLTDSEDSAQFSGTDVPDECEAIDMSKKRLMQEASSNNDPEESCENDSLVDSTVKVEKGRHDAVSTVSTSQIHSFDHSNSDSNSLPHSTCSNNQKQNNAASPKEALDSLVGRLRANLVKEEAPAVANNHNAHSGHNGNKVGDVNAIADSLKFRQELEMVRKDLTIREEENYQLQQDLRSSRQELQELKEKLVIQNSLLSDLSREFYDLSNHFMKVSHHFKTVVTEVQRTTERLT